MSYYAIKYFNESLQRAENQEVISSLRFQRESNGCPVTQKIRKFFHYLGDVEMNHTDSRLMMRLVLSFMGFLKFSKLSNLQRGDFILHNTHIYQYSQKRVKQTSTRKDTGFIQLKLILIYVRKSSRRDTLSYPEQINNAISISLEILKTLKMARSLERSINQQVMRLSEVTFLRLQPIKVRIPIDFIACDQVGLQQPWNKRRIIYKNTVEGSQTK